MLVAREACCRCLLLQRESAMPINPEQEKLIPIRKVPAYIERVFGLKRCHISAIYRWVQPGRQRKYRDGRAMLETYKAGGGTYTSHEALLRFFMDINEGEGGLPASRKPDAPRTPGDIGRRVDLADDEARRVAGLPQKAIRRQQPNEGPPAPHGESTGIAPESIRLGVVASIPVVRAQLLAVLPHTPSSFAQMTSLLVGHGFTILRVDCSSLRLTEAFLVQSLVEWKPRANGPETFKDVCLSVEGSALAKYDIALRLYRAAPVGAQPTRLSGVLARLRTFAG